MVLELISIASIKRVYFSCMLCKCIFLCILFPPKALSQSRQGQIIWGAPWENCPCPTIYTDFSNTQTKSMESTKNIIYIKKRKTEMIWFCYGALLDILTLLSIRGKKCKNVSQWFSSGGHLCNDSVSPFWQPMVIIIIIYWS